MTGPNGVGKTSLAEALWLFRGRYNPAVLWNLHVQRQATTPLGQGTSPLTRLGGRSVEFEGREGGVSYGVRFEYDELMQISAQPANGAPRTGAADGAGEPASGSAGATASGFQEINIFPSLGKLRATYHPDVGSYESEVVLSPAGPIPVRPIPQPERASALIVSRDAPFPVAPETIERFSNVVARGEKRRLLKILQIMQPRVRDVEILSQQGTPSLWADVGAGELLPVEAAGGGVVRLLGLIVNFYTARGGLIVIDEVENGIHYSVLPKLWEQIRRLSDELDVQTVITTHSAECLRAAVTVYEESETTADLAVHRMYEKDGVRAVETYADAKLLAALDLGLNIR